MIAAKDEKDWGGMGKLLLRVHVPPLSSLL